MNGHSTNPIKPPENAILAVKVASGEAPLTQTTITRKFRNHEAARALPGDVPHRRRGHPTGPATPARVAEMLDLERRISELEKSIREIRVLTIRVSSAEDGLRILTNRIEYHTRLEVP